MGERVRVTVVSDYICPWCYVGLARAERLEREFAIEVIWHPYELHPEIPPEGRDVGMRAAGYYDRLRPLFAEAGLAFEPPTRVPNSHAALEAAEFAREHGAFESYHRALFEAYFSRGRDLGDVSVLAGLASECGLDGSALTEALESKRYASLVDQRSEEARGMGVTGTPTFVFEDGERRFALVGAQDYNVFADVTRRMGAEKRTENLEPRTQAKRTA